jgi:hypothetical protein
VKKASSNSRDFKGMPQTMNPRLQQFIKGYAQLLDAPGEDFHHQGITFVGTTLRDLPEWANWLQPIWLFGFEEAVICSVSPTFAEAAQVAFADVTAATLLNDKTLARANAITPELEWVRCELFYYPHTHPPQIDHTYTVEKLLPGAPGAARHLRNFDGGVYVIRATRSELEQHEVKDGITAAAFVKNKGVIREIAVGTEEAFRRQGRGQTVVAHAIADILAQGCVPTYWPDSFANKGSYALARTVGMVKVAEMLFCAQEINEWQGFSIEEP